MATQLFANNAKTVLASGISAVATSLTVTAGTGLLFPVITGSDYFLATLCQLSVTGEINFEIVKVTARTSDVFTIVRAQEGTTALAYVAGDKVELRLTKETMERLRDFTQTGTGAVARTVQDRLLEVISVKDFGAAGDGATDDYTAFTSALAASSSKLLRVPAGTYKLPFTTTVAATPLSNCVIEGDGPESTILRFEPSSATYRTLFDLVNGGVTFRNIGITVVAQSGQTLAFFVISNSGFKFDNCDFDGAMTNTGATLSHTSHGLSFPETGTQTDIEMTGCDLHRMSFGVLKTNTATSAQSRLSFANCDLYGNYNEDLAFNSPLGSMDGVQVNTCRFRDGAGSGASLLQLYASFASITNFQVSGCTFKGTVAEAIHIEENSGIGAIKGNVINVDGSGIVILDNNVSGTSYMPYGLAITGNAIQKTGTAKSAGTYGISLVYDGSSEVPAKRIIVQGNTVRNFAIGCMVASTLDDACGVTDNIADNCTRGFEVEFGSYSFSRNTSRLCDTGLYNSTWGSFDQHTFISCTLNADAVSRPIALTDPTFLFPEFSTTAASTTYKSLLPAGTLDYLYGMLNISVFATSTIASHANRRDEVTWDGTTFTSTNKISEAPGSITVTSVRNSSNLSVSIFTTTIETGVNVQAKLNGMAIIGI